jgi:hypothetical protein
LRRLLIVLSLSTAITAPIAVIPSSAAANYAGGTFYYPNNVVVSGPEWVGDLAAMDENVACSWFFGPPPYPNAGYWLNPCAGHVPSTVCAAVITANWEVIGGPVCGWEVEADWVNVYGYVIVGSYVPYSGRNIYMMDNWG